MKNRNRIKVQLKRFISVFLAVVMSFLSLPLVGNVKAAGETCRFAFDSSECEKYFSNPHSVTASFNAGEGAYMILADGGADPYILFNAESAQSLSADVYKYAVVTYKTPVTNSPSAKTTELFMCAGAVNAPTGGCSVTFAPQRSHKYRSEIIDMTGVSYWNGNIHSVRFDIFSAASDCDVFYLSSLAFCSDAASAAALAETESARANGCLESVPESLLSSTSFDLGSYTEKYWLSDVIFNESVYPLASPSGGIEPISLMYGIKSAVSVRDSSLNIEYKYGKDYTVSDGKLIILPGSSIKTVPYSSFKTFSTPSDMTFWQPTRDGGYTFFSENGSFHRSQLSVTYTRSDVWTGPFPESKTDILKGTLQKLKNKEHLTVVFNGDSITYGCNASSLHSVNCAPYMPLWTDMTIAAIKAEFAASDISYVNTAVGGMTSGWGADNAQENIAKYSPDLAVIAFGMNDGTLGVSADEFVSNIKTIIDTVRKTNPLCEFIIIAPPRANPETFFAGVQDTYLPELLNLEGDGVAIIDMGEMHEYLLTKKKYSDMTGNNVNHPNDFFIRLYTQMILCALTPSELDALKSDLITSLESCVRLSDYREEDRETVRLIKETAKTKISEAKDAAQARKAYEDAVSEIGKIKTASEYESETLDLTRLVFDREAALSVAGALNSTEIRLSSDGGSVIRSTGDDPYVRFNYTGKNISADKYKYIMLVYNIPTDCKNTTETQIFFSTDSCVNETPDASYTFTGEKGKWAYKIVNLSGAGYWSGNIRGIRIDPFKSYMSGDSFGLYSLCLFETEKEALEYAAKISGMLSGTYFGTSDYTFFDSADKAFAINSETYEYLPGDADGNGRVTSVDSMLIKELACGGSAHADMYAADVDSDGILSAKDFLKLSQIISGLYKSSPSLAGTFISFDDESFAARVSERFGNAFCTIDFSDREIYYENFEYMVVTCLASSGLTADFTVKTENSEYSVNSVKINGGGKFESITVKLPSAEQNGKIKSACVCFSSDAPVDVKISAVSFSQTRAGANRAAESTALSANRKSGLQPAANGYTVINYNGSDAGAVYGNYTEVAGNNTFGYSSALKITFDRIPESPFDRFSLSYTSSTMARGIITYNVDGAAVEDEFFLEASPLSVSTFSSLITDYMSGKTACDIISVTLYPLSASSSKFSLTKVVTEDIPDHRDTLFLENDNIKAGILLSMGGGISHFEMKNQNGGYTNLLNSYDVGRLIQQSYYGIDRAPYELGEMNGQAWRYNPVQGGDIGNNPSRIIDIAADGNTVYVKTRPMDWGHRGRITPSYMENKYTLYDNFLKVDNRFVDFSCYNHTPASQELPAFYTVSALSNFSMYNGSSPWTDAPVTTYSNLKFWASNPDQYFPVNANSENWYAWTDSSGFGVGLYVPNASTVLAGRFGEALTADPKAPETNYFAPLRTMTLKSGKPLEYSYLICAGKLSDIRNTFKNNRALVNNSKLLSY